MGKYVKTDHLKIATLKLLKWLYPDKVNFMK